ncbi:hypothetical protein THAOC_35788 [Thalassiosira oceanica]|uniref:Uncharacterized protein n=1 Tax=Thalassiosira oceanica TaxID=159749 RepID=K0R2V7_THAOC|nr:hypothetical protein THAOC_35788 [Thalassiosira oceanica]|eukprot:EJK45594.1 hypothetical protein THAOC_35788 [Thalassiosira oceanica]
MNKTRLAEAPFGLVGDDNGPGSDGAATTESYWEYRHCYHGIRAKPKKDTPPTSLVGSCVSRPSGPGVTSRHQWSQGSGTVQLFQLLVGIPSTDTPCG